MLGSRECIDTVQIRYHCLICLTQEVIYHSVACILYLVASVILIIEVNHWKNSYYYKYDAYLAAAVSTNQCINWLINVYEIKLGHILVMTTVWGIYILDFVGLILCNNTVCRHYNSPAQRSMNSTWFTLSFPIGVLNFYCNTN